jgi:hypothetical protein
VRRFVRVTDDLFDLLEALLPGERGEDGTPSIADFVNTDLVAIADYFAEHWDKLPSEYPGRDDYRTWAGVATSRRTRCRGSWRRTAGSS